MGLISCPECNKNISDKATICVHCGYPLKSSDDIQTQSLKKVVIFSRVGYTIAKDRVTLSEAIAYKKDQDRFGSYHEILDIDADVASRYHLWLTQPRCPKCGSTAIATGQRGWKWTTGFLGSSKTVNRCGNCGHTWSPGR